MQTWKLNRSPESAAKSVMPEKGQAWIHKGYKEIYIRIDDIKGSMAAPDKNCDRYFFSINQRGGVVATDRMDAKDGSSYPIQVLKMSFSE